MNDRTRAVADGRAPVAPLSHTGVMAAVWPGITIEVLAGSMFLRWTVNTGSPRRTVSAGPGTVAAPQVAKVPSVQLA